MARPLRFVRDGARSGAVGDLVADVGELGGDRLQEARQVHERGFLRLTALAQIGKQEDAERK